jgi:hypothetical protein
MNCKKEVLLLVSIFLIIVILPFFVFAESYDVINVKTLRPSLIVTYDEPVNITSYDLNDLSIIPPTKVPISLVSSSSDKKEFIFKPDNDLSEEIIYQFFVDATDSAGNNRPNDGDAFKIYLGETTIDKQSPSSMYQSSKNFNVVVFVNRNAVCKADSKDFNFNEMSNTMTLNQIEHLHSLSFSNFDGNTMYIKCNDSLGKIKSANFRFIVDSTSPTMLYVNDTSDLEMYPDGTKSLNSLRVKFLAEDKESRVDMYNYSIKDSSEKLVSEWMVSSSGGNYILVTKGVNGSKLNLKNNTKYFFYVQARNNAGAWSDFMKSDGITVNTGLITDPCHFKCGGECDKCKIDQECLSHDDCISGFCDVTCKEPSCSDDVLNGDETDIDCGGSCGECEVGKKCIQNIDCESKSCNLENNTCVEPTCFDDIFNGPETDTDCGGSCMQKCELDESCITDSDCLSNKCSFKKCTKNDDADNDGMNDDWERENGLSTSVNDAESDKDNDGLTNYKEFLSVYSNGKTNPSMEDTDGDGYNDGLEVEKDYDPTDPKSHPTSPLFVVLFIFIIVVGIGGLGYYMYSKNLLSFIIPNKNNNFSKVNNQNNFSASNNYNSNVNSQQSLVQGNGGRNYNPSSILASKQKNPKQELLNNLRSKENNKSRSELFESLSGDKTSKNKERKKTIFSEFEDEFDSEKSKEDKPNDNEIDGLENLNDESSTNTKDDDITKDDIKNLFDSL